VREIGADRPLRALKRDPCARRGDKTLRGISGEAGSGGDHLGSGCTLSGDGLPALRAHGAQALLQFAFESGRLDRLPVRALQGDDGWLDGGRAMLLPACGRRRGDDHEGNDQQRKKRNRRPELAAPCVRHSSTEGSIEFVGVVEKPLQTGGNCHIVMA
jgi:hypothetical protein